MLVDMVIGFVPLALDNIITFILPLKISKSPFDGPVCFSPPMDLAEKPHYNLRPWEKKDFPFEFIGGLGDIQASTLSRKTRGRNSNLSKA